MTFSAANTIWVLLGAALVFFMQAGFAMCEAGFTRAKNTGNILMKNLMDFCIGTPLYWLVGFSIIDRSNGTNIGSIAAIDDSTPNILFELDNGTLIPASEELIESIDAERQRIEMNIPQGLLEM